MTSTRCPFTTLFRSGPVLVRVAAGEERRNHPHPAQGLVASPIGPRVDSLGPINLAEKLASFTERWQPRTVAEFNGHDVMLVKAQGEFVWHKHDETDDFFLVLRGELEIQLRDRSVTLRAGDLFIVPKGIEHRPVAREEVHLLLVEPSGTPNTGDRATAQPRRVV